MEEALAECDTYGSDKKIPWTRIAENHGVVRSTLTRKHRGETRSVHDAHLALRNLSPQEEAELINYIEQLTADHLPPTREMVQNFASNIAGHPVSMSWVDRFVNKNSEQLTTQWSTSMDRDRHAADSHEKYERYFAILREKIEFYDVEPQHTYNMDEKGFMVGAIGKQKRIFSRRLFKKKRFRQQLQDGNREWISLIACVCGDGSALPPSLIYAADSKNIQDTWVEDVKVGEHMAFFGVSSSGWSNDGLGLAWLQQVFERFTAKKARRKYRLLLVDGHSSHLTEEFLEYCHRHKILLAVYPPHSTHTLQPLDVVMFKPLSTAYSKALQQRLFKHRGLVPVKKSDFFKLFWDAWVTSFSEKNVLSSFASTGISPFNPNVILQQYINSDSNTSSDSEDDAQVYEGEDWRLLNRVAKRATTEASSHDANAVLQSLHHIAIQNQLLQAENDGLRDALVHKKRGQSKGKALALLQHYEYWGPEMMWTPRSFREAKVRMIQAQEEKDKEEREKSEMKELQRANKLYNDKIAEEAKAQRARDAEARRKAKEKERAAIDARKEQRRKDKEAREAQKDLQLANKGKRKITAAPAAKKKQKRSAAAARSRTVAHARSPTPPPKYNSRGRKIAPCKRLHT
jgi:hypothetical protein